MKVYLGFDCSDTSDGYWRDVAYVFDTEEKALAWQAEKEYEDTDFRLVEEWDVQ